MTLVAWLLALVAILAQPQAPAAEFSDGILHNCHPLFAPGAFIGCSDPSALPGDDPAFAGLRWTDHGLELVTGP